MYEYTAEVLRVIEGSRVDLDIDLGLDIRVTKRFKLGGVVLPSLRPSNAEFDTDSERKVLIETAKTSAAYVRDEIEGKKVRVVTFCDTDDQYRVVIYYKKGTGEVCLNDDLVLLNYAKPYE